MSESYLRLAVLFQPAEDAAGQLGKICDGYIVERLKKIIHDRLELRTQLN